MTISTNSGTGLIVGSDLFYTFETPLHSSPAYLFVLKIHMGAKYKVTIDFVGSYEVFLRAAQSIANTCYSLQNLSTFRFSTVITCWCQTWRYLVKRHSPASHILRGSAGRLRQATSPDTIRSCPPEAVLESHSLRLKCWVSSLRLWCWGSSLLCPWSLFLCQRNS